MRKILSVAMTLICAGAVTAQETKPTKSTSPAPTKTKPAEKAAGAKAAKLPVILDVQPVISVRRQAPVQVFLSFTTEQQKNKTSDKTVEAEALEAKLVHISHLASQAAHATDLDAVEKTLSEMEQQLMEARAKLWKAREAEAKAKKEGKAKK